jgi:hypothetical protein
VGFRIEYITGIEGAGSSISRSLEHPDTIRKLVVNNKSFVLEKSDIVNPGL